MLLCSHWGCIKLIFLLLNFDVGKALNSFYTLLGVHMFGSSLIGSSLVAVAARSSDAGGESIFFNVCLFTVRPAFG